MPEGPELHLSSRFVTRVSDSREFVGKILERLPPNRPPKLVDMNSRLSDSGRYTVTSWSRGKELMLAVKPLYTSESKPYCPEQWTIRFNFGMTGCFKFTRTSDLPKHAKVCFTAVGEPSCTLSYVDMRGFGRWTVTPQWSKNRGPCILQEHDLFRAHVLDSLAASVFSKPICEVMLDQRYFNGVGNYLRAEALYRLGLRPFVCARDMLCPLPAELKVGKTDLLQMCHQLAKEVVAMGGGKRYDVPLEALEDLAPSSAAVKPEGLDYVKEERSEGSPLAVKEAEEVDAFEDWLQCYYQPGMQNLVDHQGRTVWFAGDPGPLAPKARKKRHETSPKKSKTSSESQESPEQGESDQDYTPAKKRVKRVAASRSKTAIHERKPVELKKATVASRKTTSKKSALKNVSAVASTKTAPSKEMAVTNGAATVNVKKATSSNKPAVKNGVSRSESKSSGKPTKRPELGERRSKRLSGKSGEA